MSSYNFLRLETALHKKDWPRGRAVTPQNVGKKMKRQAVYGWMFTSVWVQAYRCLSMYWSPVLAVYCVVGRRDQSCGSKGVYACVCTVITGMPARPSLWPATCGMPDMYEWASGPGEMQAVCMLLLCPLQWDGLTHGFPVEWCHSDIKGLAPDTEDFLLTLNLLTPWCNTITTQLKSQQVWCKSSWHKQLFLSGTYKLF